ncbi:Two component regulator three Y domain-containing protein [Chryseobacterium pennae]|uniref:Two component regulator three Y domain-containing protein n=1 Tax=Chryseobacterium pennae TaxID=2258962 RepID=A0A3D9CEP9_9FLAO|nr:Two component regulator three Y domain-containing protein [Chryseobacterium pennae]REC64214.1 Two component regulator three Y domain-containing protein [Chryseobacterium pennae]
MIKKILSKIMTYNFEKTANDFEHQSLALIHRYLLFLFFIDLFYSVFIILFFGDTIISIGLIMTTFLWLFLIMIKGKIARFGNILKKIIALVFIILTLMVSFFYVFSWKGAGVEYFYFSLLFAIPFFFNYKEDYFFIFLIVTFITVNFIGSMYFEIDFLPKSKFIKQEDFKLIKLLNILFVITTFIIDIYFISQKNNLIYGLMKETEIKDSTIGDLQKVNDELMKQQIITNNLTEDNITEIIELAENDSPVFFEKFQLYFPDFIPNILNINSNLIYSELYICTLMRLNFDTKKIASCINCSVRAVESRKYRIRKKLGISSDININNFILKI